MSGKSEGMLTRLEANQMGSDVVGSAGILGGKQVMSQESSSFPSKKTTSCPSFLWLVQRNDSEFPFFSQVEISGSLML